MRIVLDANILCTDYRMEGTGFRVFLAALPRIGAKLFVPQVVVDEVAQNYRRDLQDAVALLSKASTKWRRLTGQDPITVIDEGRISSEATAYAELLSRRLEALGSMIIPYPATGHPVLVRRALERRRPFQESGSGYRDALIWESLKTLVPDWSSPVYFVTNNRRDFGEGPDPHPDLMAELRDAGAPGDLVRVVPSLEKLNAELIIPRLTRVDDLIRRFSEESVPEFSLRSWVEDQLKDVLRDQDWDSALLGLDPSHSRAWLSTIKELGSVWVDDVRLLPTGDIILSATARISGEVAVDGDPEAYFRYSDVRDLWGDDPPDAHSTAWFPIKAAVAFSLVLKADSFQLLSVEIDEVDGDYGTVVANPHPRRAD